MQLVEKNDAVKNSPMKHVVSQACFDLDSVDASEWKRSTHYPTELGKDELSVSVGTKEYRISLGRDRAIDPPELTLVNYPETARLDNRGVRLDNALKDIETALKARKSVQLNSAREAISNPEKLLDGAVPGSRYEQGLADGGRAIHWKTNIDTPAGKVSIFATASRFVSVDRYTKKTSVHYGFEANSYSEQFEVGREQFHGKQLKNLFTQADSALKAQKKRR